MVVGRPNPPNQLLWQPLRNEYGEVEVRKRGDRSGKGLSRREKGFAIAGEEAILQFKFKTHTHRHH